MASPSAFSQCTGVTWDGAYSNSWTNAGLIPGSESNWSTLSFPNSSTTSVCIGTTTNNPVTLSGGVSVDNLALTSATSLNVLGVGNGLGVYGNITNSGTISVNNAAGLSEDSNSLTLSGGGTLILGTSAGAGGNIGIGGGLTNPTLTNVNNTIEGEGVIGFGISLDNEAIVNANFSGQTLLIGTGSATNTGTMEATLGGVLELDGLTVNNAGGSIVANTGTVYLPSADIQGGTLIIENAGVMGVPGEGTATLDGSTAAGPVTIQGPYTVFNATQTNLLGTINNEGSIQINGGSQFGANLALSANTTLTGGGIINLSNVNSGPALIGANSTGLTLTNVNNTMGQATSGTTA
jgi:hypothetical protein